MDIIFVNKEDKKASFHIPKLPFVVKSDLGALYLISRLSDTEEFVVTVLSSTYKEAIGSSFYEKGIRNQAWLEKNLSDGTYNVIDSKLFLEEQ